MQAQMEAAIATANDATVSLEAHKQAQDLLDEAESIRLSKLKVNVTSASGAVDQGNKPVAQGELSIAKSRLVDVTPDPEEQIESARRAQLVAEGKTEQAKEAYGEAVVMASEKSAEIGRLEQKLTIATLDAEKAREEAQAALTKASDAQASVTAQIKDAVAQEDARIAAETRAWQVNAANLAGGGLFVAALGLAACCFLLPVASTIFKKSAFVAGIGCAACFALARFLSSPWFDYAWKITAGALIVAGIGWAAWELRQAIKRSQAARKAADNAMVAEKIIPVLDNYYKHVASPEAIKDMDKPGGLWDALDDLGGDYDASVKRIKAEQAENTVKQIKESVATEATLPCEPTKQS